MRPVRHSDPVQSSAHGGEARDIPPGEAYLQGVREVTLHQVRPL